jgi:hypothetical protein
MRYGKVLFIAGVVLAAGGCASTGQRAGRSSGGDESVISSTELRESTALNLLEFIRARRPRWLERNYAAVMRPERVTTVAVFLDNQVFGGPDALSQFPLSSAQEVRYFSPSDAQMRFGPGYINGVIQVISRTAH